MKMSILSTLIVTTSLLSTNVFAAAPYNPSQSYQGGSQVEYQGNIYEAKWWVGVGETPVVNSNEPWQTPWKWVSVIDTNLEPQSPIDAPDEQNNISTQTTQNGLGATVTSSVTENLHYYLIDPDSPEDIRHALNNDTTVPRHGRTDYNVAWKYTYAKSDGICSIATAEVNVNTKYVMPKLSLRSSANSDIKHKFDTYFDKLMAHERNHHNFGVQAAKEIEQLIFYWAPESCQTIGDSINGEAHRIINYYGEQDRIYDEETNHGYTEGVVID
ncbi:DUF922 domain-containing protein [Vibrio sp. NTOU-M3]|uniref:DUF922 domain-containing protein n=1 Tax=Vibrio sp. NTOU-M3 TaxID=3234954 RepID=UPI00349F2FB1